MECHFAREHHAGRAALALQRTANIFATSSQSNGSGCCRQISSRNSKLDIGWSHLGACIMQLPSAPYHLLGLAVLLDNILAHFTSSSKPNLVFQTHAAVTTIIRKHSFVFILDLCNVPSTKFSRRRAISQSPTAG
jgi:hypothetical protein